MMMLRRKQMSGGLRFMVNKKMCLGVEQERLIVALNPATDEEVLEMEGEVSPRTSPVK